LEIIHKNAVFDLMSWRKNTNVHQGHPQLKRNSKTEEFEDGMMRKS
jgi:hypothetical protein